MQMLSIDYNNNIQLTRGDSMSLIVTLEKDGVTYTPVSTDSIRFALSKSYSGMSDYQLLLEKEIPYDTLTLTLTAEDTQTLNYGTYNYDIELTLGGTGSVHTFISAEFTITGECE